jgi:hypothetical protein
MNPFAHELINKKINGTTSNPRNHNLRSLIPTLPTMI